MRRFLLFAGASFYPGGGFCGLEVAIPPVRGPAPPLDPHFCYIPDERSAAPAARQIILSAQLYFDR